MLRRLPFALLAAPLWFLIGCDSNQIGIINSAPNAAILEPESGHLGLEGRSLSFRGRVDDGRTPPDELLVSWSSSIDGQLFEGAPDEEGITAFDSLGLSAGSHLITLRVIDDRGATGVDEVELEVTPNQPPEITLEAPLATTVYHSDVPVQLHALVIDTEDPAEDLRVSWRDATGASLGDELIPASDGRARTTAPLAEGSYTLTATVTDTGGKTAEQDVSIVVGGPNNPPLCEILGPADGSFFLTTDVVELSGYVEDGDVPAPALTVSWSSSASGPLGSSVPGTDGAVALSTSLPPGPQVISLEVLDEVGVPCVDQIAVDVSSVPEVEILAPVSGATIDEGGLVLLEAIVSDFEDPPPSLTLELVSDVVGTLPTPVADAGGALSVPLADLAPGTHTLTLTATDSDDLTASDSVTVLVNGAPTPPEIALSPDDPVTGDGLAVTITSASVDPEGDAVNYLYSWSRDGTPLATWDGAVEITDDATSRDEVWQVTVQATDGTAFSAPVSASVTILNTAPTTEAPLLRPPVLTSAEDAFCIEGASDDADGDSVSIEFSWRKNGSELPVTGPTLDTSWFERGDRVRCWATPFDGSDYGEPVGSATVSVRNSPPGPPTVSVVPEYSEPGESLLCTVETLSVDIDGDAVSYRYEWLNGGAPTAFTSEALPPGLTEDGEIWTCQVTPSDDLADGPPASASAVVCETLTWHWDGDGDGFGDFHDTFEGCEAPPGYVPTGDDCDDTDPSINPFAGDDPGDGVDTDCDGMECAGAEYFGAYFTVCLDNGSWFEAETACISGGYDGLASILSAGEENTIVDLLLSTGGAGNNRPWIGITDQFTPGTYEWTDGSDISYANWAPGQPDEGGAGDGCGRLSWSGSEATWDDASCDQGSPGWTSFICGRRLE